MTYLIFGCHRSGTSMLMKAIAESSDIIALTDPELEKSIRAEEINPDHDPNPHGYWELDIELQLQKNFYFAYEDKLFKIRPDVIRALKPGRYNIIAVHRDPVEIKESWARSFGYPYRDEVITEFNNWLPIIRAEPNNKLIELNFVDIINDPETAFTTIKNAGWPIDVERAVGVVDKNLYRIRKGDINANWNERA